MIRIFNKKDIDQVMKIWLETNIKTHTFIKKDYYIDNYDKVKELIIKSNIFVYEKDKCIVGFVGIINTYIAGIFVMEGLQNNGIGKSLIDKCKSEYDILTLNVYEKNIDAVRFYLRENFYIVNKEIENDTKEVNIFMKWKKDY